MTILELKGLTKHFGGIAAVVDLDLAVEKGEILGIIGPNGAGKSTMFNLISGEYKPTRGKVIFNKEDITGLKSSTIARRGIARTFQITTLFKEFTVLENMLVGFHFQHKTGFLGAISNTANSRRDEAVFKEKAQKILKFLGIESFANTLTKNLPYGTQRTVGIALAIVLEPKIMLLDEPFSGMAGNEIEILLERVKRINSEKGMTIILVEHNMQVIMKISHRIAVLNFGRKITEGLPQVVSQMPEVIEAYLGENEQDTFTD